jgi:DNA-directed RNA polymerase subunit K/omega
VSPASAPEVLVGEGLSAIGPLESRFHVVAVACQRVLQLRDGSRPRLAPNGHKACVLAVAEVLAGAVPFRFSAEATER